MVTSKKTLHLLVFHNAKGCDMHPLPREISKENMCKFEGILNSAEKIFDPHQSSAHQCVEPSRLLYTAVFCVEPLQPHGESEEGHEVNHRGISTVHNFFTQCKLSEARLPCCSLRRTSLPMSGLIATTAGPPHIHALIQRSDSI